MADTITVDDVRHDNPGLLDVDMTVGGLEVAVRIQFVGLWHCDGDLPPHLSAAHSGLWPPRYGSEWICEDALIDILTCDPQIPVTMYDDLFARLHDEALDHLQASA